MGSSARPHEAKPEKTYLETLKLEVLTRKIKFSFPMVLNRPPYSPDIAPSDYHLFRSTAHGSTGEELTFYEDCQNWTDSWIALRTMSFLTGYLTVTWKMEKGNDKRWVFSIMEYFIFIQNKSLFFLWKFYKLVQKSNITRILYTIFLIFNAFISESQSKVTGCSYMFRRYAQKKKWNIQGLSSFDHSNIYFIFTY